MDTAFVSYKDNGSDLEGFVAYPDKTKRPLVILCHAWSGRDPFICEKAQEIAQWGYVGFALDIYGKGILGQSKEENAALKKPWIENREALQKRLLKSFEVACKLPYVDQKQIAVLGFGFGGICALDLARSGVPLKGAISVYGHFTPPPSSITKLIKAKIFVLHGYNDPITSQEELHLFEKEMDTSNVDWQVQVYGNTLHAFATPGANDKASGILYNPVSASRAWTAIDHFLKEIFEPKNGSCSRSSR